MYVCLEELLLEIVLDQWVDKHKRLRLTVTCWYDLVAPILGVIKVGKLSGLCDVQVTISEEAHIALQRLFLVVDFIEQANQEAVMLLVERLVENDVEEVLDLLEVAS